MAETGVHLGVAWWWMMHHCHIWFGYEVVGWVGNKCREPCTHSDVVVHASGHGQGNVWVTK